MRKTMALRFALLCAVCILMLGANSALASSPVGRWSGSFGGSGKSGSASATFRKDGSCTLHALGFSASGSYGGGSIHVSAYGYSMSLSYSCSGNSMTIRGRKGKYSGSMHLKRVGGSSSSNEDADSGTAQSVYASWTAELNGLTYEVSLYKNGFLYWSETPLDQEAANGQAEGVQAFGARLTVSGDMLVLVPLADGAAESAPSLWPEAEGENGKTWKLTYGMDAKSLTLRSGEETLLTLKRGDPTDALPPEALFRPYIALKKGDRGEAVVQLQEALVTAGYLSGAADGKFGSQTQAALKAFQTACGMEADGVADQNVFEALYK